MKSRWTMIFVGLVALAAAACSKSEGKKAEAAPTGPLDMTADAFYREYTTTKGLAVLEKFGNHRRIKLSGSIQRTMGFPDSHQVWLNAPGGRVTLTFTGSNVLAVKSKDLKPGASFGAECEVQGMMGSSVEMRDCSPK
jgi:hypothetical protein